jgi:hypothetical protein
VRLFQYRGTEATEDTEGVQSSKIHHEGTKDTKNTKKDGANNNFLFCLVFYFVAFVSFVPSWCIFEDESSVASVPLF